jgi:hypothetical protein
MPQQSGATFTFQVRDASYVKIKNSGDWDWGLMVQMMLPGGAIECFSSDPEMEVGS